jgi:hypothetical protein
MHGQMAGRIALNRILRLLFRGVDRVALKPAGQGDLFLDRFPARGRLPSSTPHDLQL